MFSRQVRNVAIVTTLIGVVGPCVSRAQTLPLAPTVSLIDTKKENGGWDFSNGQEFPGAKGSANAR